MRIFATATILSALVLTAGCSRDTMSGGEDRGPGTASQVAHMSKLAETPATPGTCAAEIGDAEALKLIQKCKAVSGKSQPDCNDTSTCQAIRQEIALGCSSNSAQSASGGQHPECSGVTEH
ncbi:MULTISPECIES: hypothetical protein [Asticcacaulis]|uniref:hypothetical protein n=1 Tax=Asticcacaulis TaxID=76890 RepID=UPI001AEB2C39|nr:MULTISPECIES: hypothetical protein [Asticcacaulis]MBP2158893.1 hypothetical protein [Asticcacaulis solisilvae]MDR6799938.1 hypothetical protein [Asticcacaulis sp. BE141]